MKPIRNSRQRAAILAELAVRTDHPTAETIYHKLKADWPGLSLGTVYRNLAQLCEMGQAQRLEGLGADHFDGNASNHLHIICGRCGAMMDLHMEIPEALQAILRKAGDHFEGEVTGCALQFTGVCQTCLQAKV